MERIKKIQVSFSEKVDGILSNSERRLTTRIGLKLKIEFEIK